jgi:FtsH-binding integral membrane protein
MYPNTVSTSTGVRYDEGLRQFMLGVFNNMSLGLALSAVIAYFVGTSPALMSLFFAGPQKWVVIFAPLAVVFFISFRISSMSPYAARAWFFGFAALMGLSLATVFAVFKMGSIANAFFSTTVMFGLMSLWGYTTKRDLTKMGSFLMMGVIGLFAAALINLFMQSSVLAFAVSAIAVVVFTLLTAFDVQNLKNLYDELDGDDRERAGVMGALSLYINFVNIFTSLLQLLGERKD